MLNQNNERELAYIVKVDDIKPIEGRDRVECAVVGGWTVMVRKNQFKPGDLGIYFEIDSKVSAKEPFEFLEAKHYKIKTQKYKTPSGQFWSQGLLMSADDFGWELTTSGQFAGDVPIIKKPNGTYFVEGDFLTKELEVTYAEAEDNKRKSSGVDKYKKMAGRHPKLFKNPIIKWIYKRGWGKKLLFVFFGNKKDNRNWLPWVVKTDEERIQNMPWILEDKSEWIASEKIDGTSTTMTMRKIGHKYEFYVCSRNVVFDKPDKSCYYETNVYTEMAEKYNVETVLKNLIDIYKVEWVTIQGETYGAGVQKRDYELTDHNFAAFNLIFSDRGRINSVEGAAILGNYGIPWVPIVDEHYILPDTVEEVLEYATGESAIDGGMREGIVFRSQDGQKSFKAVSNEYLIKYHG